MRYLPFLLGCVGVLGVVAGINTPAHAQNYPWCVIYGGGGGGAKNCGFTTYEQCMAATAGGSDFCVRNYSYSPATPSRRH
jgi:hypothetical protein